MKTKKALERSLKLSDYSLSEEKVPEACKSPYTGQSTPRNTRYIQENEGITGGCQRAANDKQNNPCTYQKNLFHGLLLLLHFIVCFSAKTSFIRLHSSGAALTIHQHPGQPGRVRRIFRYSASQPADCQNQPADKEDD